MLQTLIEWQTRWAQRYHLRELARRRALGYDDPVQAWEFSEEEKMRAWNSRPWKDVPPLELGKTGGFIDPLATRSKI
jgi:hypothetical protein